MKYFCDMCKDRPAVKLHSSLLTIVPCFQFKFTNCSEHARLDLTPSLT